MNNIVKKKQYSGYNKKLQYEVFKSALKEQDERVSADESGVRPLYRPREWKTRERAIEKQKNKKKDWFRTRSDAAVILPIQDQSYRKDIQDIHPL